MNNELLWSDLLTFLSPGGQQQIIDFVRRAQVERGANWLPELKNEFPMFSWIIELVATKTADEAFNELQATYKYYPLHFVKPSIVALHERLRAELERGRF